MGQVIGGNKVVVNTAGFMIHGAIHMARLDINAVYHTYSPAGKAWSTFGRHLDIIRQDTCNFRGNGAVYEDSWGMVLLEEEGHIITGALGYKSRVMVVQNHDLLTVYGAVDEADCHFTPMERSYGIQILFESSG